MLTKDHHCLESILEAADRILEYTSGIIQLMILIMIIETLMLP
jgi:uncharacterized protein with HEPN domain